MILGEDREHLAVDGDAFLVESGDKLAIRRVSELADCCVDAHCPEFSKFALLEAAVGKGILACVLQSLASCCFFGGAPKTISFSCLKD